MNFERKRFRQRPPRHHVAPTQSRYGQMCGRPSHSQLFLWKSSNWKHCTYVAERSVLGFPLFLKRWYFWSLDKKCEDDAIVFRELAPAWVGGSAARPPKLLRTFKYWRFRELADSTGEKPETQMKSRSQASKMLRTYSLLHKYIVVCWYVVSAVDLIS